jgi:hypothetical protein
MLGSPLYAQLFGTPGTEAFPGLSIEASGRSAGLADAACALPEGAASLGINPAGLAGDLGRVGYSGSLRAHPDGANAGAVAYSHAYGDGTQYALSATYLDYGSIQGLDDQGRPTGVTMRPISFYPALTFARVFGERWKLGASLKLADEYLGDFQGAQGAVGIGADVGAQYQPPARDLGFGFALINLGKKVTGHFQGDTERGSFPGLLKAGLFYHPKGWEQALVTADAELPFYDAPALALGIEYHYLPQWDLRAGTRWDTHDIGGILNDIGALHSQQNYGSALKAAAGTSLRLGNVGVDYALQWWVNLGFVNTVTIAWIMGG